MHSIATPFLSLSHLLCICTYPFFHCNSLSTLSTYWHCNINVSYQFFCFPTLKSCFFASSFWINDSPLSVNSRLLFTLLVCGFFRSFVCFSVAFCFHSSSWRKLLLFQLFSHWIHHYFKSQDISSHSISIPNYEGLKDVILVRWSPEHTKRCLFYIFLCHIVLLQNGIIYVFENWV